MSATSPAPTPPSSQAGGAAASSGNSVVPPREPTEAMQNAMVDAMFDGRGDLKRRELMKIVRKGWRAGYDAARSAPLVGTQEEK